MNDYLSKPIDPEDLEAMLQKWLKFDAKASDLTPPAVSQPSVMPSSVSGNGVWDQQKVLQRCSGKPDRLKALIDTCLDNLPKEIKFLRDAAGCKDYEAMVFSAHTIKGVANNLSGVILAANALALETAIKNESPFDDLLHLIDQVEVSFDQLHLELQGYLQRTF